MPSHVTVSCSDYYHDEIQLSKFQNNSVNSFSTQMIINSTENCAIFGATL